MRSCNRLNEYVSKGSGDVITFLRASYCIEYKVQGRLENLIQYIRDTATGGGLLYLFYFQFN